MFFSVLAESSGRCVLIALWLFFIITSNAETEFPKSDTPGKRHSHKHSGSSHHVKHEPREDHANRKVHTPAAHHEHTRKSKPHHRVSSILEQSASRRGLRDGHSKHQVPDPLIAPLATDQDEAELFNTKNDLLDTKVFLTDPDLQPMYYHSVLETKSHVASKSNSTLNSASAADAIHPSMLQRIIHAFIAFIGICLLIVGAVTAVHTDYRRKVLDEIKSQGASTGPRVKEALRASWCKIGNYVGHGESEKRSAIPIIDPVSGHLESVGGA
ncbi:hypothetical protein FOZ61_001781 [Perkinsus olseni]|uniref:Uncharacterized protein n=1 Tax=Perkinsus olseni TaxID=32597 RepID=A0A7J6LVK9_PEROL|nr:hypothetical protein FOZ61_001781 [Perkinsus olseni]